MENKNKGVDLDRELMEKRLNELEAKEAKVKEYNKNYYRNWKENFDKMKRFYEKWNGKNIKGVVLE